MAREVYIRRIAELVASFKKKAYCGPMSVHGDILLGCIH